MKNFWKFIVFTCLLTQFGYANNTNKNTISSFQKKIETTFSKESVSSSHFVRPTINRGISDLKQHNRIPAGLSYFATELQPLSILRDNNLKIVVSDQDIDRCNKVSILLFPFHYFW